MSGRGWRLTPKGERWLIDYPLAVGMGAFLGLVAYLAASGGM